MDLLERFNIGVLKQFKMGTANVCKLGKVWVGFKKF